MNPIQFTKMHGLGNDFVVIDAIRQRFTPSPQLVRWLADRHFGIGCDQLLLVEPPARPDADFRYRIFNADGGEVAQCGNGARCFARFVVEKGLTAKRRLRVETASGVIEPELRDEGEVAVDMGVPLLEPARIPFVSDTDAVVQALAVDGAQVELTAVSMGNPHAVLVVEDVDRAPVAELGAQIERHPRFPERVNVGFMQVLAPDAIRLRVFERGAGETLACGTGACAAVVAGTLRGLLRPPVTVHTRGGRLRIEWAGPGRPVIMIGPARTVFEGVIDLDQPWELPR
jgi:diaminopimelate epimerase